MPPASVVHLQPDAAGAIHTTLINLLNNLKDALTYVARSHRRLLRLESEGSHETRHRARCTVARNRRGAG